MRRAMTQPLFERRQRVQRATCKRFNAAIGEIALPTRIVTPMLPEQVKAIRKSVAKSPMTSYFF